MRALAAVAGDLLRAGQVRETCPSYLVRCGPRDFKPHSRRLAIHEAGPGRVDPKFPKEASGGRSSVATVSEEEFRPIAEVAVQVGVNLQPGQNVILLAPATQVGAARAVTRAAYAAGARNVRTLFNDEVIERIGLEMAPEDALGEFPKWLADGLLQEAEGNAALLSIIGGDPENLKGVPSERIMASRRGAQQALQPFTRLQMAHKVAWSLVAAPSPAWARKVFPDLPEDEAVAKLWQAILRTSRCDGPDPVAAWHRHIKDLQARRNWLNGLGIRRLHYKSPITDLTIELPKTHQWVASGQQRAVGYPTSPNIPTEEVFTLPERTGVDGKLRSTRKLSYSGQIIDGIEITFAKGRIVDFHADQGEDALRQVIETDEGSHYLGEVALVPVDSPISESGILFYNTLFDENASCHLAIGAAYPTCLTDAADVHSDEDLLARGGNVSLTHVDFMIGSDDLDITAETTSGAETPIFRAGRWAAPIGG